MALTKWMIDQVPGITAQLVTWGILFGAWVVTTAIPELVKALPGIITTIVTWTASALQQINAAVIDLGKALAQGIFDGFVAAWATIGPKIMETIQGAFRLPSIFGGGGGGRLLSTGGGKASQYAGLISQVSGESGVPPDVLAALIDTENSGERSTSPAGAQGLMQVVQSLHARPGEDPFDPLTSIRQGARVVGANYERRGDWNAAAADYFGHGTDAGGMTTGNYTQLFSQNRQRYSVAVPRAGVGMGDITMTQAQWGEQGGMTAQEAAAACGPYAAFLFAQATGRNPNPGEAEQLARLSGWTEAGMGGTGNFMNLLGRYGVNAVRDSTPTEQEAINAGPNVAFSTPEHYFASTGYDPATNKFNVGATGTYAGGSTMMSYDEMARIGGGIQDIIVLAGQMGPAFQKAGEQGGASFGQITNGAIAGGAALVSTSTDTLGNVTAIYSDATGAIGATVTNAAGVIVNSWGTMATGVTAQSAAMSTGVVENTNLMASGALTSVTNLGTGILTSVATTSGTTIATVTDMQGQVTSQYATLANGAVLEMGNMSAGVLTSTTDLGTGVMTTVQDMSGNYITTITDLSGNVTAQYTQLGTDVATTATTMSTDVVTAATEMATGSTEQAAAMATDVTTSATAMSTDSGAAAVAMADQIIADAQRMAADATEHADMMQMDVTAAMQTLAKHAAEEFGDVGSSAQKMGQAATDAYQDMTNIPHIDLGDTVKQFGSATKAADAYRKALVAAAKASEDLPGSIGGSKGGSKEFAKRAAGGPVDFGQMYLVGEHGPELFMPTASGTIVPNTRLQAPAMSSVGGGGDIYVTVQVNTPMLSNERAIEEAVVQGIESARLRGRL